MQYIGEYYMDGLNTEKYSGYTLLNLRASYNFKNFGVWFNVLNVTDELYAARVSKSYYGSVSVKSYSVGMPRTFYIGLKYKFKAKK
jgi:outer membrane receptor protein involved in Fe transport